MEVRRWKYVYISFALFQFFLVECANEHEKEDNSIYNGKSIHVLSTVHVGLVGFEDARTKGFDHYRLKLMLQTALEMHQPHIIETGIPLPINFKIAYDISANIDSLEYERILANSIVSSSSLHSTNRNYIININSQMEEYFERLSNSLFNKNNRGKGEYSIFFVMINKERLKTILSEIANDINYVLVYNSLQTEQTLGGQSWISSKRFVVVDLSAGSSTMGYSGHANDLLVSNNNYVQSNLEIPTLESVYHSQVADVKSSLDSNGIVHFNEIEIESMIATMIISSIENVFYPDLRFHSTSFADKVLIPIIVLRNHNYFNPLSPPVENDKYGIEYRIDISTIKKEITKLFKNKEDVAMISGIHSLHEHRHFSLAIAKATRTKSFHIYSPSSGMEGDGGKYIEVNKDYIDSSSLLSSVFSSHDFLASSFLSSPSGDSISDKFAKIFFNPGVPDLDANLDPTKSKVTTGISNEETSSQNSKYQRFENRERINKYGRSGRSKGTKILPVFVLSLMPDVNSGQSTRDTTVTFDRDSLLAVGKELVIVLQVNNSGIEIPYKYSHFPDSFFERKQRISTESIKINGRSVTKNIIAGISSSLGSLIPPFIRYSSVSNSFIHDYTFALGSHPFGYFSNSSQLSQIHVDTALRNVILTRIAFAYEVINSSIQDIDQFAKEYLYDPFSDNIFHAKEGWTKYIEKLYHEQVKLPEGAVSPIAITTVYQLHKELHMLSNQISIIAKHIEEYRLEEAYILSSTLEITALSFEDYVNSLIEESVSKLLCCSLMTDVKLDNASFSMQNWLIMIFIFLGALVWFFWFMYILPNRKKVKS